VTATCDSKLSRVRHSISDFNDAEKEDDRKRMQRETVP